MGEAGLEGNYTSGGGPDRLIFRASSFPPPITLGRQIHTHDVRERRTAPTRLASTTGSCGRPVEFHFPFETTLQRFVGAAQMSQESITYLTNIIIGLILSASLTYHWIRQGKSAVMRIWVLAAWVMTVADVFFAVRPHLPYFVSRTVPTLLVTVGQALLFLGAELTADRRLHRRTMVGLVLAHAAILVTFYFVGTAGSNWRSVCNGLLWAGLAYASAWRLRAAPTVFWKPLFGPANAFLAHGIFHTLRLSSAIAFQLLGWSEASSWLQAIGDFEVSFFMVALFVGLLVAHLQQRHEELHNARMEVQTLTELLPICSWCKKIRNDNGYWQRVEEYFGARRGIRFTHGICLDCYEKQRPQCSHVEPPATS